MQKRIWNYKDDDSTRVMNNAYRGILDQGVFRGYNLESISGNVLTLIGDGKEVSEGVIKDKLSVLITPQGVVVKEDEAISVTVASNTAANPRIDLLYVQHEYIEVEGGIDATYAVKAGTPAEDPQPPEISVPKNELAIAYITVPAGWNGGEGITYNRVKTPNFAGDTTIAKSDEKNEYLEEQKFIGGTLAPANGTYILNDTTLTSGFKGRDLYVIDKGDSSVQDITTIDLGGTQGKIIKLITFRPLRLLDSGELILPNEQTQLFVNENDVVNAVQIEGLVSGKKWLINVSSDLRRDVSGNYIFDNGIIANSYIQADYFRMYNQLLENLNHSGIREEDTTLKLLSQDGNEEVKLSLVGASNVAYRTLLSLRANNTNDSKMQRLLEIIGANTNLYALEQYALWTNLALRSKKSNTNGKIAYTQFLQPGINDIDIEVYNCIIISGSGQLRFVVNNPYSYDKDVVKTKIYAGKEITIINPSSYSTKITNLRYLVSGAESELIIGGNMCVSVEFLDNGMYVLKSEQPIT